MIDIVKANLSTIQHADALIELMNTYATDPMGGGIELAEEVKRSLAPILSKRTDVHIFLAFVDSQAAGLMTSFEGFSTFQCKPLLNIHDVIVASQYRGLGLSRMLFDATENLAIKIGCCKLTLEVLENNTIAKTAYSQFGFKAYELDPKMGKALFWEKPL